MFGVLQFKVTRRHLLLHFSQFSFIFAVNLNAKLNQFNYRNLEMFRNECTFKIFLCEFLGADILYLYLDYALTLPMYS